MKKTILSICTMYVAVTFSAAPPARTLLFNGGRVEPVSMSLVKTSSENLNFCIAHRFPDGTIYLNHTIGIHNVTERGCRDWSLDDGKTWQNMVPSFGGFNAYLSNDGFKCNIACWDDKISDRHTIKRVILAPDGQSITTENSELMLPFRSTFRLHRDVLRLRDGRLLLTGYGRKENAPKLFSFVIESKDDGKNWSYLSTILEDPTGRMPEGPNECAVVELTNGELLAYVRVGSTTPLLQLRSTDGGRNWSSPVEIAPFSVAPSAKVLADGTLAVITGRPKLYLLLDFTGTGRGYQRCTLYSGSGSSYASILEIKPNQLMIIYDESDFSSWRNSAFFSRIVAMTLNVVRDDASRRPEIDDPEAAKYEFYYSPATGLSPSDQRIFDTHHYRVRGQAGNEQYYEICQIPERPHPVLRLVHHSMEAPHKFSNFAAPLTPGAKTLSAGFEFRLGDAAEKRPQFALRFCFEGGRYGWITFGTEKLIYRSAGKLITLPFAAGTSFNAFTLEADSISGTYRLFCKGKKQQLFSAKLTEDQTIPAGFLWGDGSTDVYGSLDLSYIGFSTR